MREKLFITVAVCTRNRAKALASAAASVLPQLDEKSELLIVDNGSTDETAKTAAQLTGQNPSVRSVIEDRAGISFARNTAVSQARGDVILFFDDDELVEANWLETYRRFFEEFASRRIGCVGGPYIAQQEISPPPWMPPDYGAYDLGSEKGLLTGAIGPAGGNCAYVKEAVLKAGGFATELVRYEDSEMNCRLRDAGYEVWWLPEARVRHVIPASRFHFRRQMRLWFSEGCSVAIVRWRSKKMKGQRLSFLASRLLLMPVQTILQICGAALGLLVLQRRAAARLLFRACRSAGIFVQTFRIVLSAASKSI